MTKPNILILGSSGSGKTTSLRNLPRDNRTLFIDAERKSLPFANPFAQHVVAENYSKFKSAVTAAHADTKVIVVDSLTKLFQNELKIARSMYKNYDIFTNYASKLRSILDLMKSDQYTMIATALDEIIRIPTTEGNEQCKRCASTLQGKEMEGKVEPEFTFCLVTDIRVKGDNYSHVFHTKTDGVHTAKTPMDIFQNDRYIDNDVTKVLDEWSKVTNEIYY